MVPKPVHVRVLRPGSTVYRSSLHRSKLATKIPRWRAGRPPIRQQSWYIKYKSIPKINFRRRKDKNQKHLRPMGNMMPTTMKYARLSALASFIGYRFPMKFTRDQTLCIYRYYLPPATLMRVNRGDNFGSRFPFTDWTFMNHNRLYNAKYYNMFYHLLIKARTANQHHGDVQMMLINEGVLLNSYPHPLLPLLRAHVKQQSIEYSMYPDYEPIFHFVLTAMFVPDAAWFLRYMMPYIFHDKRNIKLISKLLTIVTDVKALHLVQFYDRTFLRKMSFRYSRLYDFRKHEPSIAERRKYIYSGRKPVEDYLHFEVPGTDHA